MKVNVISESTNTRYLMQGRMNLMSDEECAENLAEITGSKASNFKDVITQKKLICAGSAPTMYGINSCQVSNDIRMGI